METVAFYSYKGGAGRTLLVANTAQFLAMSGRRVVVLDLDLEAPGLHYKLGNSEVSRRARNGNLTGAVDELLNTLSACPSRQDLRGSAIDADLPSESGGSLTLIPAGSAPLQTYWEKVERLQSAIRSTPRNGGLPEAILELQARIADELSPEFLLVDSRTGITELSGLATSILADRVVCLTTTAPESVDGTRVVADALRAAPRLSSQSPIRIEFLVTRVPPGALSQAVLQGIENELGGAVAVLPHDPGVAIEERVLSRWRPGQLTQTDDEGDPGEGLFSATLEWIARSFPGHEEQAEKARRRMSAVHYAWRYLTRTSKRRSGWIESRTAWPLDQLREQVRFGKGARSRLADIVVYDANPDRTGSEPLMIIEYVDREDRDAVARWWGNETAARVVAVLGENQDRRVYSRRALRDSRAHHSDRWDLPLPHDFIALDDPTDVSVESLLGAVRRGHTEYLGRIVTEWVRCSAAGLNGGSPWIPERAQRIIDELARVDDVEVGRQILWAAYPDSRRRDYWLGSDDAFLDEQVVSELFSPLLWRLPAEASVTLLAERGGRMHGPGRGTTAVGVLARDLLGLRYNPDEAFRSEAQRILSREGRQSVGDDGGGIYKLAGAFQCTEISFEISSDLPPLALLDRGEKGPRGFGDLGGLLSERIAARSLVTTGLLGNYMASSGRVVLYSDAISQCAERLALRARHVGSVTLVHETIHALSHLGRDLDGRMWSEFALPSADSPLFEPSWFHETLAQLFTYRHLVRLRDRSLLNAFEVMSARSAPAYRGWRRLASLPVEDARNWFLSVRRGVGGLPAAGLIGDERLRDDG